MRILVIEDERDLNLLIKKRLKDEGYSVDSAYDGEEAIDYLESADYDLLIVDIMMPKKDGLSLIFELRAKKRSTPAIFLSAKDTIEDRVKGLDAGADDYLVKPFAFEELLARIRVLLRKPLTVKSNVLTLADLSLNVDTHEVKRGDVTINLSAKEFNILRYMLLNQGIVLSRETIEEHIWDYDYMGASNMVDVYIRYLRRKIDEGHAKKLIHTVRGMGYVLKEE